MANLTMTNWHIQDKTPYIKLGSSGENNASSINITVDELVEGATYYLDIGDANDSGLPNTQEMTPYAYTNAENENIYVLQMKPLRSWLGHDGIKLLQVRCVYTEDDEEVCKQSNVIHGIVTKNTGFVYQYSIAIFEQYIQKIKELVANLPITLSKLKDVAIDAPTDGQVLKYDEAAQKWVNGASGGGGGSSYSAGNGINIRQGVISTDTVVFIGTREEWEQLTTDEQNKYNLVTFTNDSNVIDLVNSVVAYSTIPLPSAEFLHKTIVYVGNTNATQTKGAIYRCEYVNNEYVWVTINDPNGGESALIDLTDVAISNPTDGQYLRYNETLHKWENVNGDDSSWTEQIINDDNVTTSFVLSPNVSYVFNNRTSDLDFTFNNFDASYKQCKLIIHTGETAPTITFPNNYGVNIESIDPDSTYELICTQLGCYGNKWE
jgi:hypothetical protein